MTDYNGNDSGLDDEEVENFWDIEDSGDEGYVEEAEDEPDMEYDDSLDDDDEGCDSCNKTYISECAGCKYLELR